MKKFNIVVSTEEGVVVDIFGLNVYSSKEEEMADLVDNFMEDDSKDDDIFSIAVDSIDPHNSSFYAEAEDIGENILHTVRRHIKNEEK